jgi:4-hydroxy-tetrahydrodipicolinate reductase
MKLAVAGCAGRMGLTLVRIIRSTPGCLLVAGSELPGSDEAVVRDKLATVAASDLTLVYDVRQLADGADAVIDFTSPESTAELARACAEKGKILIAGTTGLGELHIQALKNAAERTVIVSSGNMSLGVIIMEAMVEKVASLLGVDYDIEVDEMHHRLKKDAPSGTALMLARAAARGRGVSPRESFVHYGEVVGEHRVTFAGPGENIEFTHRAFSRDIYAHGALKAAHWAVGKPAGLYTMRDVLDI